jgi:hypothetical protein
LRSKFHLSFCDIFSYFCLCFNDNVLFEKFSLETSEEKLLNVLLVSEFFQVECYFQ